MKKAIGYVYVIAAAVCWGFLGLFNRVLTAAGVSLLNMMPLRFGGTAILFTVFCMMFKQQVFHIKLRHLPIFLGSGLISMLLVLCGCALVSGIVGSDVGISLEGLLMGLASELCYGGYTILLLIQKKGNRGTIPLGCWTNLAPSGTADAFLNPVGLRRQDAFLFKLGGNLFRAKALQRHIKNAPDNLCSFCNQSDRAADKTCCPVDSFQGNAIILQINVTFPVPILSNRVKGPNRKEV